jgi:hypothetical protein
MHALKALNFLAKYDLLLKKCVSRQKLASRSHRKLAHPQGRKLNGETKTKVVGG